VKKAEVNPSYMIYLCREIYLRQVWWQTKIPCQDLTLSLTSQKQYLAVGRKQKWA